MSPLLATLLQVGLLLGFAIATVALVAGHRDAPKRRCSMPPPPTDQR